MSRVNTQSYPQPYISFENISNKKARKIKQKQEKLRIKLKSCLTLYIFKVAKQKQKI